ncbi:MAG: hypothetical protein N2C14_22800, partial [Planctomycetales bacterium]
MSSEPITEPDSQTWREVRLVLDELARRTHEDLGEAEFYTELLTAASHVLAALGGVVWAEGSDGFHPITQLNHEEGPLSAEANLQPHAAMIRETAQRKQGRLVGPRAVAADSGDHVHNPSDLLLVLGPVINEDRVPAVIEIFQRPDARPSAQQGYLRFLQQLCGLAAEYHKNQELRNFRRREQLWARMTQFTADVHRTLDFQSAVYDVANEGRRLIDCDRVSVAVRRGHKYRLESVSGQDEINRRSNAARLLEKLLRVSMRISEPMRYPDQAGELSPQIEQALQAYLDDSHARAVTVLPLREPEADSNGDEDERADRTPRRVLGALVVEQFEADRIDEGMRRRMDVVVQHAELALNNVV